MPAAIDARGGGNFGKWMNETIGLNFGKGSSDKMRTSLSTPRGFLVGSYPAGLNRRCVAR